MDDARTADATRFPPIFTRARPQEHEQHPFKRVHNKLSGAYLYWTQGFFSFLAALSRGTSCSRGNNRGRARADRFRAAQARLI